MYAPNEGRLVRDIKSRSGLDEWLEKKLSMNEITAMKKWRIHSLFQMVVFPVKG